MIQRSTATTILALGTLLLACASCEREIRPNEVAKPAFIFNAQNIENVALREVKEREAPSDLNYASTGVIERTTPKGDNLYYVTISTYPHVANAQRTVVVNGEGEVVHYAKGYYSTLPKE